MGMLKWPDCDKRSISGQPHRFSLWSVAWAFLSKLDWSGIFWSVCKCLQGCLKYPVQQSLCRMLPSLKGKESKEGWSCRWSRPNTEGRMLWQAEIRSHQIPSSQEVRLYLAKTRRATNAKCCRPESAGAVCWWRGPWWRLWTLGCEEVIRLLWGLAGIPIFLCSQSTVLSCRLVFNWERLHSSHLLYWTRKIKSPQLQLTVCRKKEVGKFWKLAALQYGIIKGNSNKTWKFSHHSGTEYVLNKIPFQLFSLKQKLSLWP